MPASTTAIRFHENGKPEEVARAEEVPLLEMGPGEVRVRLLAASINPSDLGMLMGVYGRKRELPAVAGREGAGEVIEVGANCRRLQVGDFVRMPEEGAWQAEVVVPESSLMPVPNTIPPEQASMAFVNPPTAWRLLEDFGADLKPGDWVAQNAANSALGHYLIQLCKERGLRSLNVVRDAARWEEPLRAVGGDAVVSEDSEYFKNVTEITDGSRPKLAINTVGGPSAIGLIRALADGGTQVTLGGMVGDPVRFPTRNLIFNDVCLRGFWLDRWMRTRTQDEIDAMFAEVFARLADGRLHAPVASRHPLSQIREALEAAQAGSRNGKVLLVPDA